ncbi:MAG: hypothetical protein D6726_01850 [Nitrospirae bacterium]|nr:MAG: hypothetical protein D6726_01850 [Nitrospirota bacterium]
MEEKTIEKHELNLLDAEFVKVSQSSIRSVEGGHIELSQVGAMSIDGERIEAEQSASCIMRGDKIKSRQSISCITYGNDTEIESSLNGLAVCRENMNLKNSISLVTAANTVNTERANTLLLLSREVKGDVQTLLDWKSALSVGAIITGVIGLFSILRRR